MITIVQQLPISSSVKEQVTDTSIVVSLTPEKNTRVHTENSSIDSTPHEYLNTTSDRQLINNESNVVNVSINGNNMEVESFVSKSTEEEEQKDIEKIGGESYTPSVGSNSAKSESILKESPLSDEQHLNQTNSEQQQQHTNQLLTISEKLTSATPVTNNDLK